MFDLVGLPIPLISPPFFSHDHVAFIKQEALEKTREIKVKSDGGFSVEAAVVVVEWKRCVSW